MTTIPKLIDLCNGIKADIEAAFTITIPTIGKNFFRAMANSQGAKLKLWYLVLGNIQKNIFIDTAESEDIGGTLERFARVKLGRNRFPAVAGVYALTVTGTLGAIIPASTVFKSNDDSSHPGFMFILDDAYALTNVTDVIQVRALTAGVESELIIFDKLTATAPISLVSSNAYVSAIVTPPKAAETIEEYRKAGLLSYRLETQGGSGTDYRLWAQDVQGVAAVYPYAKTNAPAELNLYVESNIADSIDNKGTPSAQMLLDVEFAIQFSPDITLPLLERGRWPLGVFDIAFLPITVREIDIVIPGFVGVTLTQKALILAAMQTMINAKRPFVASADILANKNDILDPNNIIAVIITAIPGASFAAPTFTVDGVPMPTFTFFEGDIPDLNSISYI